MVFGFFWRNVVEPEEEKKFWNNDARPSYETTRARFRLHKCIREGNVPKLRPIPLSPPPETGIASYRKGTTELVEKKIERIDSPSGILEEGEIIVSDTEILRPHYNTPVKNSKESKAKRRRRKRRRTD